MTFAQTCQLVAGVQALWPHQPLADSTPGVWHALLERVDYADAEAAVRELAGGGREFAPPVGMVVKTIGERGRDLPEWDEAYREILAAVRRFGSWQEPQAEHWSSPLIAGFMAGRGVWMEWCLSPAPGTSDHGTFAAQQREAFKAARARVQRDTGLLALGAPRRSSLNRLAPLEAAGLTPPPTPELQERTP
jgi:hypothetical protein